MDRAFYLQGYSFIDGVSEVIEKPMDAHLQEILGDKKLCPKKSKIRSLLASFMGKDSDAVQDIELSLQENLAIFLDDDVKWHLRDNPLKARPTDLNRGISLFNCFPEDLLDDASYPALFRLQTNQVLQALQNRSPNSQACALVLDECASIGKLPALPNLLATGRSRRCSCWVAIQDYSQLENIYGKEGARGIINLCRIKCILGCEDAQTQKVLGDMAGEYRETKTTTSDGEHGSSKTSKTYEWRKVVEPKDLMSLDETEELILFIKGRYMRIKKHFYFEDFILSERNQEVMDINEYKED
ncbi:MAG: TraM recognition domain-containing protein [Lachnospiraceae bacterium]|nr:TraM recognition domain-containing protein [Lachnospiraceae bacterium]